MTNFESTKCIENPVVTCGSKCVSVSCKNCKERRKYEAFCECLGKEIEYNQYCSFFCTNGERNDI